MTSTVMPCLVFSVAACPPPKGQSSISILDRVSSTATRCRRQRFCRSSSTTTRAQNAAASDPNPNLMTSKVATHHQDKVEEKLMDHAALRRKRIISTGDSSCGRPRPGMISSWDLSEAYDQCLVLALMDLISILQIDTSSLHYPLINSVISSILKTVRFLWKGELEKTLAALAVWGRRTDELVDGAANATPEVLDNWEERLVDVFEGRPHDIYDAALFDVISKYSLDIQIFKDLIEGMRMDLRKTKYENFDELRLYSYYVAAAPMILSTQVIGVAPDESIYLSAFAYALTLQLTDILRDVPEDARKGRIYLPQDELATAGISEDNLFSGEVTPELKSYVEGQVNRARMYADEGNIVIKAMKPYARFYFLSALSLTRQLLDQIEANDYDLTKPTPIGVTDVILTLLRNLVKSLF